MQRTGNDKLLCKYFNLFTTQIKIVTPLTLVKINRIVIACVGLTQIYFIDLLNQWNDPLGILLDNIY